MSTDIRDAVARALAGGSYWEVLPETDEAARAYDAEMEANGHFDYGTTQSRDELRRHADAALSVARPLIEAEARERAAEKVRKLIEDWEDLHARFAHPLNRARTEGRIAMARECLAIVEEAERARDDA